jgi:hypothetical protein
MLLTPQWKKSITPFIVETICKDYSQTAYNQKLADLVYKVNHARLTPDHIGFVFNGEYYIPFEIKGKLLLHTMTVNDGFYYEFRSILNDKKEYVEQTKKISNYILTGLAMCHTTDCLRGLFPQYVLDAITETHRVKNLTITELVRNPSLENARFTAFNEKNEKVLHDIAKQLLINLIKPGN